MNAYWKIGLVLVLLGVGFAGGWAINGWRLDKDIAAQQADWQKQVNAAQAATKRAQDAIDEQHADLATALARIDNLMSAADQKAQDETNAIRSAVAAGTQRLYVHATCPPAGTGLVPSTAAGGSVDHGAAPGLDAPAQSAYFALRDGLGTQRAQLLACQAALTAERAAPAP